MRRRGGPRDPGYREWLAGLAGRALLAVATLDDAERLARRVAGLELFLEGVDGVAFVEADGGYVRSNWYYLNSYTSEPIYLDRPISVVGTAFALATQNRAAEAVDLLAQAADAWRRAGHGRPAAAARLAAHLIKRGALEPARPAGPPPSRGPAHGGPFVSCRLNARRASPKAVLSYNYTGADHRITVCTTDAKAPYCISYIHEDSKLEAPPCTQRRIKHGSCRITEKCLEDTAKLATSLAPYWLSLARLAAVLLG